MNRPYLTLITILPLLAACGGGGDPPPGGGGTGGTSGGVCDAPATLFRSNRCGTAACHAGGAQLAMGLDLSGPNPESMLIGRNARTSTACVGMPLVTSSTTGVLFTRLAGDDCAGLFGRMPVIMPALTANEMSCLTNWLASKLQQASPHEEDSVPGANE